MDEENQKQKSHEYEATVGTEGAVESKDRGLFDFLGKKEEEKPHHHQGQDQVIASEFDEKVHVSEPKVEEHKVHVSEPKVEEHKVKEEEKKPGLLEKLHRSNSSSSSSSDEEEGDDEETKKKKREKKGLKEKLKEKISGDKEEKHEDTTVPVEKVDEVPHHQEQAHPEDKKGFLDKIKDKIPGQHKKPEDEAATSPPPPPATHHAEHTTAEAHDHHEGEAKEKKGIFSKLKEKIPGYHPKTEEEKEKEKESAAH